MYIHSGECILHAPIISVSHKVSMCVQMNLLLRATRGVVGYLLALEKVRESCLVISLYFTRWEIEPHYFGAFFENSSQVAF